VRTVLRALAVRQLAEGQPIRQVAKNLALTPTTVWLTSQRFRQGGLERALYERPRPGKAALLDAQQRQRIVALACGPPPEGRSRLDRAPADRRSSETQTGTAGGTEEHPGPTGKPRPEAVAGKKCRAWQNLDEDHIRRMEDILAVYEKPLREREPVVCVDEKPVVLHREIRPSQSMRPGRVARCDGEYQRCGTANVFCGVQPKAGRYFPKVTANRSSPEFADYLLDVAIHYRRRTPSIWFWTI
jgi:Winged helix-turn helix/DDE superfamily endonuclease